ncbi:MAG: glycosyltransferase family 2 protein [Candidatus Sericytochromatia bacterium]|nr:glycosyltransferase family 2 protein [Candidatus Sericytochromatia bacterium]
MPDPATPCAISIVILNYQGRDVLEACLASVAAQTRPAHEVIVVDNASPDGSGALAAELCQRHGFRFVASPINGGYSAGNALGIREATGTWLLLLNNDAELDPGALGALEAAILAQPDVAMFSTCIVSHEDPGTIDTLGIAPYRDGMSRGLARLEPIAAHREAREVFAPSGCAGLYRRDVYEESGGLPEVFFAYCEDFDLGLRFRWMGHRCMLVPEAIVRHRYSAAAGRYSAFKAYLVERNHLWVRLRLLPLGMVLASPWHSLLRYGLQAWGVLTGKGSAGKFRQEGGGALELAGILLRAYGDTLKALPRLLWERRQLRSLRRVPPAAIRQAIRTFGLSARELALKD